VVCPENATRSYAGEVHRIMSHLAGWKATCCRAIVAIAVLGFLSGCNAAREPGVVPPDLIGVWKTDDPRYIDRYFELTADTITVGTGENGKDPYAIHSVAKHLDMRGISYLVTYVNPVESVTDTLSFDYEPRDGGMIRLKSQRSIVWKRAPGP
jgi:hypothetical protein